MATKTKTSQRERAQNYAEQVAQTIIDHMEQGTAPWQKEWKVGEFREEPHNPISNGRYSGINSLYMSLQDYDDPRWMTYKQAAAEGYQVKKGEKATTIEYWQWTKEQKVVDQHGEVQVDENGNDKTETVRLSQPNVFYAKVFNAEQIEGIEPYVAPELPADGFEPHAEAEKILQSLGVPIKHNQGDRAFYNLVKDEISLPPKGQFTSKEGYYATALHEAGHATGHGTRLNRDMSGGFGSPNYAKEELRAEIASYMLTTKLGLGHNPSNHASYVGSWMKVLNDDPREIFRAAKDADTIQTYLAEPELRQKLEQSRQGIVEAREKETETMHNRHYIKIAYEDTSGRKEAKDLGAQYDRKARSWYVPEGKDAKAFAKWPNHDPLNKPKIDPQVSFRDFMEKHGFEPKGDVMMDNQWHNVRLQGQKGKASGSYKVFGDEPKTLVVQNHKSGEQFKITHTGQEVTAADRKVIAEQREAQREANAAAQAAGYDKGAQKAVNLYYAAPWARADHAYLVAKGVNAIGIKETRDGSLAIPMRNIAGDVRSMQFISADGSEKKYMYGGQLTGNMHLLDPDFKIRNGKAERILIAEGYATGATLHQITGKPVAVAFDSGNLEHVAKAIREANPKAEIVFMADNDHQLKNNVGIAKATEAAKAVNGNIAFPYFNDSELKEGLTDWNDFAKSRGEAAVDTISKAANTSRSKFASIEM